jgi:hypothetical protein
MIWKRKEREAVSADDHLIHLLTRLMDCAKKPSLSSIHLHMNAALIS